MKGIKKIFTLLFFPLLLIAVAFTTGCPSASPIGSLTGDSNPGPGTVPDHIMVFLNQIIFEDDEKFYSDNVVVQKINGSGRETISDTDHITIRIGDSIGEEPVPPLPEGLPLKKISTATKSESKTVFVSYMDMEGFAVIYVVDRGTGVGDGDGGTAIEINWN